MAGHLLLAVFSFVVYFNAVYSAISAQKMLVAVAQFSKDFTYPRINEVAYVHGFQRPTASCLTKEQCSNQLHWVYAGWYVYLRYLHEAQRFPHNCVQS